MNFRRRLSEIVTDSNSSEEELIMKRSQQISVYNILTGQVNLITTRPGSSCGYWLCGLLPTSLTLSYWSHLALYDTISCRVPSNHLFLIIMAVNMFVESLNCFLSIVRGLNYVQQLFISFMVTLSTSAAFRITIAETYCEAFLYAIIITFAYRFIYVHFIYRLPSSFTLGETSFIVQGLFLFTTNIGYQLYKVMFYKHRLVSDDFVSLNIIMMVSLLWLLVVCVLLIGIKILRQPQYFYTLLILFVAFTTCFPFLSRLPFIIVLEFIFRNTRRLNMLLFWTTLTATTVLIIICQLCRKSKASTGRRKIFHIILVLVYLPGLLYECTLLYMATGVALALISIMELFRILEIPPLDAILKKAFYVFCDEKDMGLLAFTPFSLLVGFSLPIWLMPCPCYHTNDIKETNWRLIQLSAGLLTVGLGDSAASIIGSKYGRIKWRNGKRTLEGSVAFIIAILLPIIIMNITQYLQLSLIKWIIILMGTIISAVVEALTDQIDNLILPLIFYSIVSCI